MTPNFQKDSCWRLSTKIISMDEMETNLERRRRQTSQNPQMVRWPGWDKVSWGGRLPNANRGHDDLKLAGDIRARILSIIAQMIGLTSGPNHGLGRPAFSVGESLSDGKTFLRKKLASKRTCSPPKRLFRTIQKKTAIIFGVRNARRRIIPSLFRTNHIFLRTAGTADER